MNEDFVKIDLHIHTPGSKCYKGNKNDIEFLNILKHAKKEELKIIAVTDHNSVEGYKKIIDIKTSLMNERTALSIITDSEQTKERLKGIDKDLSVFEGLLILPGIEFEVRNGIHILIIFNNSIRIELLDKFLMDGGFGPEEFGEEEPSKLSNWDIFKFLEECKKFDCLVIDAHTDSNKGILNTIPRGTQRAVCFSSPQLNGVCYKNEEQIERLKNVLETAKEYRRKIPLAFVKFSDAHRVEEVGKVSSWVRVEKIDFESLKSAFNNPSELLSVETPSLVRILNEVLAQNNSFGIPDLSSNSKEVLEKYICSLHNSVGGYVVVGVTDDKKIIGMPMGKDERKRELEKIGKELAECFAAIEGGFQYQLQVYPLQKEKMVISVHIPQGSDLINMRDDRRIYAIRDGKIDVLSAREVQKNIEDRVIDNIERKIENRLLSVERDCHLIKNLFSAMPIVRNFENSSVLARFEPKIEDSIGILATDIQKLGNAFSNGRSKGDLFFMKESTPPRLQYTYLRYSLPIFPLRNLEKKALSKEAIYIVYGGGTYYCKKDYPVFDGTGNKVVKLYKTRRNTRYGIKFTVCFLKCSFILWYCKSKFDDVNIYKPEILRNLRMPILDTGDQQIKEKLNKVEEYFDQIIDREKEFLISARKAKKEELTELTNNHNTKIDEIAYSIDKEIYQLLKLNDEEISLIEDDLKLNEIYLPKDTALSNKTS